MMSEGRGKRKAATRLERPQLDAFRHAKKTVTTPETAKKRVAKPVRNSPMSVKKKAGMEGKAALRSNWTPEEDEILKKFVLKNGDSSWHLVKQLHMFHRSAASCRTRWKEVLDPSRNRMPFSKLEDAMLYRLIQDRGHSWKEFAPLFEGRTPMQLRGRAQLLERRVGKTTSGDTDCGLFLGEEGSKPVEEDVEVVVEGTAKLTCPDDTDTDLDIVGIEEDLPNVSLNPNKYGQSDVDGGYQVSYKEMQLMEVGTSIAEHEKPGTRRETDEHVENELQVVVRSQLEDQIKCSVLDVVTEKNWSNEEVEKSRKWEEIVQKAIADTEAKWHAKLATASQAWDCEKRLLMETVNELKVKLLAFEKDSLKTETDC